MIIFIQTFLAISGEGIQLAYEQAKKGVLNGEVNRVVLATDGSLGKAPRKDFIRLVEENKKGGVAFTTVVVREDKLDDGLVEELSNQGDGNAFYLDSLEEARKVFEEDLVRNIEVVAKDVEHEIEFNPSHVEEYRLIGYDDRVSRRPNCITDRVDGREIGAGHTVTALYELTFRRTSSFIKMTYDTRMNETRQ